MADRAYSFIPEDLGFDIPPQSTIKYDWLTIKSGIVLWGHTAQTLPQLTTLCWRHKSVSTHWQNFVQTYIKEYNQALCNWPMGRRIHWWPVVSFTMSQQSSKMFPCHGVIMLAVERSGRIGKLPIFTIKYSGYKNVS